MTWFLRVTLIILLVMSAFLIGRRFRHDDSESTVLQQPFVPSDRRDISPYFSQSALQLPSVSTSPAELPVTSAAPPASNTSYSQSDSSVANYRRWRTHLDEVFFDESIDILWAEGATARLQKELASKLPRGAQLISVECRSTMCRGESSHEDEQSYDSFARAVIAPNNDSATGGILVVRDGQEADQSLRGIAFIARGNHDLPSFEGLMSAN